MTDEGHTLARRYHTSGYFPSLVTRHFKEAFIMFGIGMPEFLLILVVALIVLGPKKLPELARSIGKGLAELKKSTEEIKENLNVGEELQEVQKDLTNIIEPTQYLDPPLSPPLSEDKEEKPEAEPAVVTPAPSFPKAPDA